MKKLKGQFYYKVDEGILVFINEKSNVRLVFFLINCFKCLRIYVIFVQDEILYDMLQGQRFLQQGVKKEGVNEFDRVLGGTNVYILRYGKM